MIFVTGANGFIGRHVVEALRASGEAFRVLLSRPNAEFSARFPDVDTVCGDLLDAGTLDRGLEGVRGVIHLASKNIDHDGSGFERINVEGTRLLAERAAAHGIERLVYVSSVGIYGHGAHRGADESTPVAPDTPFSRSKAAAEESLLQSHRTGEFGVTILRHRFVYGVGDRAVMPRLIKAAKKYPFWISGGKATMSLVWAGDLAEVARRFAVGAVPASPEDAPIFHITDGRTTTYREVITTLCDLFDFTPPRFSVPFTALYLPVRAREVLLGIDPEVSQASITSIRLKLVAQDNDFSSQKLQKALGEYSFVSLAEGLEKSLEDYRQFAV